MCWGGEGVLGTGRVKATNAQINETRTYICSHSVTFSPRHTHLTERASQLTGSTCALNMVAKVPTCPDLSGSTFHGGYMVTIEGGEGE